MLLSILIARVLGLIFLIMSIAIFINRSYFKTIMVDVIDHPGFLMLGGFINLLLGVLIIVTHNVWIMGWPVLVTIVGWLLFIRGCVLLFFPGFVRHKMSTIAGREQPLLIGAIVFCILGLLFCYFGFFSAPF